MIRPSLALAGLLAGLLITPIASAQVIWGNSAGGTEIVHKINSTTGALITNFNVAPGSGNGRGIVVVGNVIYSTVVGDNKIYKSDATTGAPLGSIVTNVPGGSFSTIAWDGSSFWTSDYAGSNKAFQINVTGTVIKTITLTLAGGNSDGMEWFNGKLIANRGDTVGPYDVYDLNGNVLQAAFISPGISTTGIAFDGTNFITSNIFAQSLSYWNGTTGAFIKTVPLTGGSFVIEDLSVDYDARIDTNPNLGGRAPDGGSTVVLLGAVLVGVLGAARRRRIIAS